MKWPFTPTWQKFASLQGAWQQFQYIEDKDVRKEWRKGYGQLNQGRQMVVRFYWLNAEVSNGGLDQYFWNSSGDFAQDTVRDLQIIGQPAAAEILERASRKLFGDAGAPMETGARRELILNYYGTHPFNDDGDQERLAIFLSKENLEAETREIYELQPGMKDAMAAWMGENRHWFTRIRDDR